MSTMIELKTDKLVISIDTKKLTSLSMLSAEAAKNQLAKIWDTNQTDLNHYLILLHDNTIEQVSDKDSFITVSFLKNGYILDSHEVIDVDEAKKQIEIDLEIINRESQWSKEDSIYFDQWWPTPVIDKKNHTMEFGISLKGFYQKVFNRTLNRIQLARYGYLSINYSLSERDILENKALSHYQKKLDEVLVAITIKKGFRFQDFDENIDIPSKSRLINLLLSAEIF